MKNRCIAIIGCGGVCCALSGRLFLLLTFSCNKKTKNQYFIWHTNGSEWNFHPINPHGNIEARCYIGSVDLENFAFSFNIAMEMAMAGGIYALKHKRDSISKDPKLAGIKFAPKNNNPLTLPASCNIKTTRHCNYKATYIFSSTRLIRFDYLIRDFNYTDSTCYLAYSKCRNMSNSSMAY